MRLSDTHCVRWRRWSLRPGRKHDSNSPVVRLEWSVGREGPAHCLSASLSSRNRGTRAWAEFHPCSPLRQCQVSLGGPARKGASMSHPQGRDRRQRPTSRVALSQKAAFPPPFQAATSKRKASEGCVHGASTPGRLHTQRSAS